MNSEFAEMAEEIERIAGATKFNDISMLNTSTGDVKIHVGTASTIDINKVDMTQSGLDIETGDGQWSIITKDDGTDGYDLTDTVLDVDVAAGTDTGYGIDILFSGEEVIDAVWALDGGTNSDGQYTLQEVVDAINDASLNPDIMFDANGVSLSYQAAEIVESDDGKYKLLVSARGTEATELDFTVASDSCATAGDIAGIFGTHTATSGEDLMALTGTVGLFEYQNTAGGWVGDTGGGVGAGLNILTTAAAVTALATVTAAINTKVEARAAFGYKMNRLESTLSVLDVQTENLMAAESRISDVDVAIEMAVMTRNQVLSQAGVAMLAQANAMPQMALTLLR